jgi:hypothetical protein
MKWEKVGQLKRGSKFSFLNRHAVMQAQEVLQAAVRQGPVGEKPFRLLKRRVQIV